MVSTVSAEEERRSKLGIDPDDPDEMDRRKARALKFGSVEADPTPSKSHQVGDALQQGVDYVSLWFLFDRRKQNWRKEHVVKPVLVMPRIRS